VKESLHFNTKYQLLLNPDYNPQNLKEYTMKVHPPIKCKDTIKRIIAEIPSTRLEVESIFHLKYEDVIARLFSTSPYFIKTIKFMDRDTPDRGVTTFAGLDMESLIILTKIFDDITFLSASLTVHHAQIFSWLSIPISFEEIPPLNSEKDFGVIVTRHSALNPTELWELSQLQSLLHFSTSNKSSKILENKCNRISHIRPLIVSFDRIYRREYVRATLSHLPTEVGQKLINLSYIGSSLATGVDLPQINIVSIDLPHYIPVF